MKNSEQNGYEVVFPNSYEHLQKLALKGRKLKCDCSPHLGAFWKVLDTVCNINVLVLVYIAFVVVWVFTKTSVGYIFLSFGSMSIVALATELTLRWLKRRGWLKVHADKVITEFIPNYLIGQTLLMRDSLLAGSTPLRSAVCKAVEVEIQATQVQRVIEQFCMAEGGVKQLPSYLNERLQQARVRLRFERMRNLLKKSEVLISAYLQTKYKQVEHFQKWVNDNVKTDIAMKLMQEAWLEEVWTVLRHLKELKKVFDKNFDKNLSDYVTERASSAMVEIATQKAGALLDALDDYYGDVLSSVMANEPAKPDESQADEPAKEAKGLTEAELAELERLGEEVNK